MNQAAVYARVSTDKQEEQRTIESQLAELREACRRENARVVQEYTDDGVSGTTLVRPGLDRLRDDASKGLFQAVYILAPDRLARKYVYQALVLEEWKKQGIEVVFLNKQFSDQPEDQLLLGIEGLIAEYERAKIVERTRRGKLHRARQGEVMGGTAPYGYRYVPRTKEAPPHYVIHDEESEVVRLIFSQYLELSSGPEVVKELARRNIRPRSGHRYWHFAEVLRILRREAYTGRWYYNKDRCDGGRRRPRDRSEWVPIAVPRVIDDETFLLAQRLLDRRKGPHQFREYLLSGLVRCRACGCRYVGNFGNRKTTLYYRCGNPGVRFPLPRTCSARSVRAERLESAVLGAVDAALRPDALIGLLEELRQQTCKEPGELQVARNGLAKKQAQLEERQRKLLDLHLEGILSREEYLEKRGEVESKLQQLAGELGKLTQEAPQVSEETVVESIQYFKSLLGQQLDEAARPKLAKFVRILVEEVVFDASSAEAKIVCNLPMREKGEDSMRLQFSAIEERANRNRNLRFELAVKV